MRIVQLIGRRVVIATAIAATLAVGCSRFRINNANRAVLVFTNETIDQAAVFAKLSGAEPVRIGTVMPGRTDTLYLSSNLAGSAGGINILARLLARSTYAQTGIMTIGPGDWFSIRLPPDGKNLFALSAH